MTTKEKKPSMRARLLNLLIRFPETRDSDWLLSVRYIQEYKESPYDFIIANRQTQIRTERQNIQREMPEFRWEEWWKRQAHSNTVKQKLRQQEKPENLIKIYEDITWLDPRQYTTPEDLTKMFEDSWFTVEKELVKPTLFNTIIKKLWLIK